MSKKILIVAADYYEDIVNNLIQVAKKTILEYDHKVDIIKINGAFEIPFVINRYIKKYDGFIALGCIIRGQTYHFEMISNEVSRKIMDLSVKSNKPIGFGVIACQSMEQAKARSEFFEATQEIQNDSIKMKNNKGYEAAMVVINNINL